jgi:RNA polymerase sigma-70 factor (ECF subfamily)
MNRSTGLPRDEIAGREAVPEADGFEGFVARIEPRLRRALVALYGSENGRDATAEALAYAWEHWDRVRAMENPAGYLFRVAQSSTRHRRAPVVFEVPETPEIRVEPLLPGALQSLTENQRLAVVLVHAFGWRAIEVAELIGVKATTVQNHLDRGLRRLRETLGVDNDD